MTFEQLANTVFRWKNPVQVRAEIDEEVRFHLQERARQLEAEGLSAQAAHDQARALFGDVNRMKMDCLTVQMGERIMLQKIQWVVIGVLSLSLLFLGLGFLTTVARQRAMAQAYRQEAEMHMALAQENQVLAGERADVIEELRHHLQNPEGVERNPVLPSPAEVTALWLARFQERPDNWRHGLATAKALVAELSPEEAVRVMTELWSGLGDPHKQQSLKAFAFERGHPGTLAVMNLGATDGALDVQNWALGYLQDYSFQSFGDDYEGYLAWHARWSGSELEDVLAGNAHEFVTGLYGRSVADVADELRDFNRLDLRPGDNLGVDVAAVFREAGVLSLLEAWLASADEEAIKRAYSWAGALDADETWLRTHVLPALHAPALHDEDTGAVAGAIRALGHGDNPWVVPELIGYLERAVLVPEADASRSGIWAAASALAEIGDPRVIPTLIGLIAANPCYDTVYGIGYYGLGKLTGVTYSESHDGTWWGDWWNKNRSRFPADVRALPVPDYGPR